MPTKLKKTGAAGKFGARSGRLLRVRYVGVESKQRIKQKCPYCGKPGAKRLSTGIWQCTRKKCNKKFTGGAFYLENKK
ncbi:MAG: 50S ribosomal protein L37ae [Nanoarchaeota archaeon]